MDSVRDAPSGRPGLEVWSSHHAERSLVAPQLSGLVTLFGVGLGNAGRAVIVFGMVPRYRRAWAHQVRLSWKLFGAVRTGNAKMPKKRGIHRANGA